MSLAVSDADAENALVEARALGRRCLGWMFGCLASLSLWTMAVEQGPLVGVGHAAVGLALCGVAVWVRWRRPRLGRLAPGWRLRWGIGALATLQVAHVGVEGLWAGGGHAGSWWLIAAPVCAMLAGLPRYGLALLGGAAALGAAGDPLAGGLAVPVEMARSGTALHGMIAPAVALSLFAVLSAIRQRAMRQAWLRRARRLSRACRRSRALAETNGLLAARAGHELRTPLNAVVGAAQLLAAPAVPPPQQRQLQGVLRRGAEALAAQIDDILDHAKLKAGRLTLDARPFDVREWADDIADAFAPSAHARQLELTCRVHAAVPRCLIGDPLRLRQIVANYVANAIKFTREGGVRIDIAPLPAEAVGAGGEASSTCRRYRFEVRDSGIGLAAVDVDALFQAFNQGHLDALAAAQGAGLGLTICAELARLMGGTVAAADGTAIVDAADAWEAGAVFRADIPLAAQADDAAPLPLPMLPAGVFVVSTVQPLIRQLQQVLGDVGVAVWPLATLGDLEQAAQPPRPGCVLMVDVRMLQWDCTMDRVLDVAARLGTRPVLLGPMVSESLKAASAGEVVMLYKPVRWSRVSVALETAMAARAAIVARPDEGARPVCEADAVRHVLPAVRGRILVVEDNEVNQLVTRALLENLGWASDVAANGREALDWLMRQPFDLVLMDQRMPVLDGGAAAQAWRQHEARIGAARTPIVLMSGMPRQREDGMPAPGGLAAADIDDIDAFLSKPFVAEQLAAVLDRVLGRVVVSGARCDAAR